ncbi:hypothetical protein HMPREF3102_02005 [Micrococcus sp. HMSC30C05]|nr:hypothetical protein HMPREF3102_02005 [Micrococcus sp. HMSC30C05]
MQFLEVTLPQAHGAMEERPGPNIRQAGWSRETIILTEESVETATQFTALGSLCLIDQEVADAGQDEPLK